jgi:hypothetical protein
MMNGVLLSVVLSSVVAPFKVLACAYWNFLFQKKKKNAKILKRVLVEFFIV